MILYYVADENTGKPYGGIPTLFFDRDNAVDYLVKIREELGKLENTDTWIGGSGGFEYCEAWVEMDEDGDPINYQCWMIDSLEVADEVRVEMIL